MQMQTFVPLFAPSAATILSLLATADRRTIETIIEQLIERLDAADGDPDLEPETDFCLAGDDRVEAGPVVRAALPPHLLWTRKNDLGAGSDDDQEASRQPPEWVSEEDLFAEQGRLWSLLESMGMKHV